MDIFKLIPGLTEQLLAAVTEACDLNEDKAACLAELQRAGHHRRWSDLQLAHAVLCSRVHSREIENSLDSLAFALTTEGGKHSALEAAISAMEDALKTQRRFMALLETEIKARRRDV